MLHLGDLVGAFTAFLHSRHLNIDQVEMRSLANVAIHFAACSIVIISASIEPLRLFEQLCRLQDRRRRRGADEPLWL